MEATLKVLALFFSTMEKHEFFGAYSDLAIKYNYFLCFTKSKSKGIASAVGKSTFQERVSEFWSPFYDRLNNSLLS